jgi:hypothetical protein
VGGGGWALAACPSRSGLSTAGRCGGCGERGVRLLLSSFMSVYVEAHRVGGLTGGKVSSLRKQRIGAMPRPGGAHVACRNACMDRPDRPTHTEGRAWLHAEGGQSSPENQTVHLL